MAKLVQHMTKRVKVGAGAKPVRFKATTVSNFVDFLTKLETPYRH